MRILMTSSYSCRWPVGLACAVLVSACGNDPKSRVRDEVQQDAATPDVDDVDAGQDAGEQVEPDAGEDTDAGGPDAEMPEPSGPQGSLSVATTDYVTTEVYIYDFESQSLSAGDLLADGDVSLQKSADLLFALERTNDALVMYENGTRRTFIGQDGPFSRIDLQAGQANGPLNPQAVVVLPGKKLALVPLYAKPAILVLDLEQGSVHSSIDLSSLHDEADEDGSPDATEGVYDPQTKLVYFVLQRIDLSVYPYPCVPRRSLVVAVDPETLTLVDLNGAEAGVGIELALNNPVSLVLDEPASRLVILAAGCTHPESGARAEHGIEELVLATRQTRVLYASEKNEYLSSLQMLEEGRFLLSGYDAAWSTEHAVFDEQAGVVGQPLLGLPGSVFVQGPDALLGLSLLPEGAGGFAGYAVDQHTLGGASEQLFTNEKAAQFYGVSGVVRLP